MPFFFLGIRKKNRFNEKSSVVSAVAPPFVARQRPQAGATGRTLFPFPPATYGNQHVLEYVVAPGTWLLGQVGYLINGSSLDLVTRSLRKARRESVDPKRAIAVASGDQTTNDVGNGLGTWPAASASTTAPAPENPKPHRQPATYVPV